MMEIGTENLRLRQWRREDFRFYSAFFGDESTARHYGGAMESPQAWRHLASVIGHWELRGFGVWAVERRMDEQLIGCAGYWHPEGWPATELAFWFVQQAYETDSSLEALRAVSGRAPEYPCVSGIVSYIAPGNSAAREAAEAIGGTLVGKLDLSNIGVHCQYEYGPL